MKLCIFDLDGTLVNSLEDLANSTNNALRKYGFAARETEEYKQFVGDGIQKLIERALPSDKFTKGIRQDLLQEFNTQYSQHYVDSTCCYDDILPLLKKLNEQGIQCAILSNKPDAFTKQVVETLLKEIPFVRVVGNREGYAQKPDPTLLLEMIDELGLTKEQCVVVGDSNIDVQMAKNAGIKSVGVTWGFRSRQELEEAQADAIIDEPMELLSAIQSI